MTRRHYANTAIKAALTNSILATDVTIAVDTLSGWPATVPYSAAIDPETALEEVVLVTAVTGTTLTVTRGFDATTAKPHSLGAIVEHRAIARDYDEANQHTTSTSGVHGLAGDVVGTTDTQTLTAKTIVGATIRSSTNEATTLDPAVRARAAATGTADILTAEDSDGTVRTRITHAGVVATSELEVDTIDADVVSARITTTDQGLFGGDLSDPADTPLTVTGVDAQTAPLAVFQEPGGGSWTLGPGGEVTHVITEPFGRYNIRAADGQTAVLSLGEGAGEAVFINSEGLIEGTSLVASGDFTGPNGFQINSDGTVTGAANVVTRIGRAKVTAIQSGISAETDLTGLSVTVSVGPGQRWLRLSGFGGVSSTAAPTRYFFRIKEGSTILTTWADTIDNPFSNLVSSTAAPSVILLVNGGTHTYNMTLFRRDGTGTISLQASADSPAYLLVEDLGDA